MARIRRSWAANCLTTLPSAELQTNTLPPRPPLASNEPSGENTTDRMSLEGQSNVFSN